MAHKKGGHVLFKQGYGHIFHVVPIIWIYVPNCKFGSHLQQCEKYMVQDGTDVARIAVECIVFTRVIGKRCIGVFVANG